MLTTLYERCYTINPRPIRHSPVDQIQNQGPHGLSSFRDEPQRFQSRGVRLEVKSKYMISRILYHSDAGIFERAFLVPAEEIERAAQAAVAAAGELAKNDARANIVSSGLGSKFAKALRLNI